jgi:hypothetical protein
LWDLVRQRAAAKADESRAKHRLVKHLLRRGLREPSLGVNQYFAAGWTEPPTTSPATSPRSKNAIRPCSNSPPTPLHNFLAVRLRA